MEQSLASAMKNINDALRLDHDSHEKEAYMKYLDCILCITCNLQQSVRDSGGDVVISKHVTKQVKLAQECIERVAVLVDKIGLQQTPVVLKSPMEETGVAVKPKPFITVPPLPSEPAVNTFSRTRGSTPMEIAYKQNHQLMSAYRARMARMNSRDPGAFNLSLTIQRKMAENLAIAKRTEMALAKKMQERQERLEEQAAKRFAAPVGMSEEEQEQRHIYKKILEYEQDAKWLQSWREKLDLNPQEPELICQLIQEILRCRDHPLTVLLKQFQYKVYEKIYPLVCNKKQRLAAVSVPLARSLWPPELYEDAVAEECRLHLLLKTKGSGDRESKDGDGGDAQTEGEGISPSSRTQGEESTFEEKFANTVQNPDVLKSEVAENGPADGESSVFCGKDVASGDARKEQSQCEEEGLESDDPKEISTDPSPTDAGTSSFADHPTCDSNNKCVVSKTERRDNDCDLSDSVENDVKPEINCSYANGDKKLDGVPESDSESKSDQTVQVTREVTENGTKGTEAAMGDFETSSSPSKETRSEDVVSSDLDLPSQRTVKTARDIKEDLSKAMEKGENLQAQLNTEQAKASKILRQITHDYESYNAENMDDLFDDEDEETTSDTKDKVEAEDAECDLPESDQPTSISAPSQSSNRGPDSLISRSSSGSSVQDFPSLPSVSEDQAEIERLSKEAYQRHVKNISADVHMYMEKLLILFTIAYEQLDSPLGRDQCYASLEESFFKPLWKFLLMLFRLANYKEELSVACKMTQKVDAGPRDIGVRKKLWLLPSSPTDASSGKSDIRPYQQAIEQLGCIKDHYTMLSKLECVVKVVHQVCDSIKDFYTSRGCKPADVPSVGADDLVPVISYVVLQSRLPQLVSECHAMSEFIHEGYIMGQEGYCLTTLETAVSYIVSSDLNTPGSPT